MVFHQGEIAQAVHFQEQYFDYTIDSLFRKSCGVLPYRVQNGKREYLIVFEQFSQCWSLPKGHMEAGEAETDTALRELFEETGLTAQLDITVSASIEYPVCGICRKQVVFFPGKVEGEPKVRQGEIETHRWVTAEQLSDYLFADTVEACRKLIAQLS
jgi:8-oxo-dGTP pyrophosphatase MutT (NUDIX family)